MRCNNGVTAVPSRIKKTIVTVTCATEKDTKFEFPVSGRANKLGIIHADDARANHCTEGGEEQKRNANRPQILFRIDLQSTSFPGENIIYVLHG